MIPVLLTTYNRLAYTKKAVAALLGTCDVVVFDNGSTDGTVAWLASTELRCIFNQKNDGVAGAMNAFSSLVRDEPWAGKVDNDTVVQAGWADILINVGERYQLDIVQARHHVIPEVNKQGWYGLMQTCTRLGPGVYGSRFVGGSGIVFRPSKITTIEDTDWKLMGWNKWQLEHPEVKKAFCDHVSVRLLDEHGYGDFPEYYKETRRL